MRDLSTSEMQFQLRNPSAYATSQPTSAAGARIVLYIVFFIPGIFFTLGALSVYPLLDNRLVMGLMLSAYLLPVVLLMASFVLKRPSTKWLSAIFVCASSALALFAFLLFLNGRLDHFPRTETKATVVRKAILSGRYGARQYHITISSWRSGRSVEDLSVTRPVFNRVAVGKTITVELHRGFWGLPWYEHLSLE